MNEKYYTEDYEAGNVIDEFASREDALRAIVGYEAADKADGAYTDGFYAIRHGDACERIWDADMELASLRVHRAMGAKTSARKAAAARENGKRGGRPRKQKQ